ncbi:hypothetical protein E2C01_078677 [Portunus trituberculatus]|uniref:Uncharacterized protein n=1 Tax=Portunus trituberculatus TaxID=210409 RepID=A0A5B7IUR5_PORTR|nr:hypothetical protein [Portunus trituberculatus]
MRSGREVQQVPPADRGLPLLPHLHRSQQIAGDGALAIHERHQGCEHS